MDAISRYQQVKIISALPEDAWRAAATDIQHPGLLLHPEPQGIWTEEGELTVLTGGVKVGRMELEVCVMEMFSILARLAWREGEKLLEELCIARAIPGNDES